LLSSALISSQEASAITSISSCGVLDIPGETYVLSNNISSSSGNCFVIQADNIILDGNGLTITGSGVTQSSFGILIDQTTRNTIKDVTIEGFSTAIRIEGGGDHIIENNILGPNNDGIKVLNSNGNTLNNNVVSSNNNVGILIRDSNNSVLTKNLVDSHGSSGILVRGNSSFTSKDSYLSENTVTNNFGGIGFQFTENSYIINNIISSNTRNGIEITHSQNITIKNNEASMNQNGMSVGGSNHVVQENKINSNTYIGIAFSASGANSFIIKDNIINSNSFFGITINGDNHIISGNTVNSNSLEGMRFGSTNGATISENNVNSNNAAGMLFFQSSDNTIFRNTISLTNSVGIPFIDSENNLIYLNNFISNTFHAYVIGIGNNAFNLAAPTGGNFWDNFDEPSEGCNDINSDGFCDNPFVFTGGQDNLPWTKQVGPVEVIPVGDLYVASDFTNEILRFDGETGVFIESVVPSGTVDRPNDVAFGPDGNLYVLNLGTNEILRVDVSNGNSNIFVSGSNAGVLLSDSIVFGPDGNLYVGDEILDEVNRFDGNSGSFLGTFTSSSGNMNRPIDLTFGPDGHLYVSSFHTDEVFRFNGNTGNFIDIFVTAGSGGLDFPTGLTFGPDGNLYVLNMGGNPDQILRYDGMTGNFIDVFTHSGSDPTSLAFGPDGNIYVSITGNDSIQHYDKNTGNSMGIFTTGDNGLLNTPRGFAFGPTDDKIVPSMICINKHPTYYQVIILPDGRLYLSASSVSCPTKINQIIPNIKFELDERIFCQNDQTVIGPCSSEVLCPFGIQCPVLYAANAKIPLVTDAFSSLKGGEISHEQFLKRVSNFVDDGTITFPPTGDPDGPDPFLIGALVVLGFMIGFAIWRAIQGP